MAENGKTIALYIGSLSRGGAEHVMVNLACFFKSQGFKVYLVTKTIDEPEYSVPDGVTRIIADIKDEEITSSRIRNLHNRIDKLRRIWIEIKPDIILSFIRKNNLMAIASSKGLGIPVVVGIRSNPARELKGRGFKQLSFMMFKRAAGIVVQTTEGKRFFPAGLQKKVVVMPNSINEEFIDVTHDSFRKKEIVLVGRIDTNKNQRMVLEVFDSIKSQYTDWSLHLYGDGELSDELRKKYEHERIVFHGSVDNVKDCIKDSSIFVLSSRQEGMPNALIEAMSLGLACISTDCPCGGPADLIENGKNGLLIPVDGAEELKAQIIRLMDDDKERERLGNEAEKISEILNPKVVNKAWMEYLESFMS